MIRSVAVLLSLFAAVTVVAQNAADLVLEGPGHVTPTIGPGSYFRIDFNVRNKGPDRAHNVRYRMQWSGVTDVPVPFGCVRTGDSMECPLVQSLGTRPVDGPVFFSGHARTSAGPMTVDVEVLSDTPDPDPTNNRARATVTVPAIALPSVYLDPPYLRVDPGSRVDVLATVLNAFTTLTDTNFTLRFAATNATIESVHGAPWVCEITDAGTVATCTTRARNANCCSDAPVRLVGRVSDDRSGIRATIDVRATTDVPAPFPHQKTELVVDLYRMIDVTTTADAGPGSLRHAFDDANGHCSSGPCKIAFAIPPPVPADGFFTIVPETPLPAITASRLVFDGRTQTAFTGDTNPLGPEIGIDGRMAPSGIVLSDLCEGEVRGLSIGNFMDNQGVLMRHQRCSGGGYSYVIADNHIGVDPTGKVAWPNLRGLVLDVPSSQVVSNVISGNRYSGLWTWRGSMSVMLNRIGVAGDGVTPMGNGASGILLGPKVRPAFILSNIIAHHRDMGVAIIPGAEMVQIRENSIRDNAGLGIDWNLDGVSPQIADDQKRPGNAPVLLSATYDAAANVTNVSMTLRTRPYETWAGSMAFIDVYGNWGADGDGESWLHGAYAASTWGDAFTIAIPGDHRGRWLNATSTRVYMDWARPPDDTVRSDGILSGYTMTSELSNAVLALAPTP